MHCVSLGRTQLPCRRGNVLTYLLTYLLTCLLTYLQLPCRRGNVHVAEADCGSRDDAMVEGGAKIPILDRHKDQRGDQLRCDDDQR